MHGAGRVYMEPKGHIVLDRYRGEWEVMPSYIEEHGGPGSRERRRGLQVGLDPRGQRRATSFRQCSRSSSTPIPETGFPLAICDGSYHTLMRTGASAAVSAKWLARKDSKVLAIVGDGQRRGGHAGDLRAGLPLGGGTHLEPHPGIARPLPRRRAARSIPHLAITGSTDLERVVRGADVIVTGTHARGWIVDDAWVGPGAHLAALGADLEGEQELDPRILQRARIFVDDIRQCRPDGEINVALREGVIDEEDIAGEIGKVICGELEGRQSDDQVTVFDSTGIALQDSATVPLEVERAVAAGVGVEKKMIST